MINTVKPKPEPEVLKFRDYKNYEPLSFNNDLQQALEDPVLKKQIETGRVDAATARWVNIFLITAEKHAPMKEKKITENSKQVPWYNNDLEELINEKNKRRKLYWLYGLLTDSKMVKTLSNKITHLKRKLKKTYYRDKVEEYSGEPKKMWQVLKALTQTD